MQVTNTESLNLVIDRYLAAMPEVERTSAKQVLDSVSEGGRGKYPTLQIVLEELDRYGLIQRHQQTTSYGDFSISLTKKGREARHLGGFSKFLESIKAVEEREERARQAEYESNRLNAELAEKSLKQIKVNRIIAVIGLVISAIAAVSSCIAILKS